jgi:hypothetical protein
MYNAPTAAACVAGICIAVTFVGNFSNMTASSSRNMAKAATTEAAITRAATTLAQQKEHNKRLKSDILDDVGITLFIVAQISPRSAQSGTLQRAEVASMRPGDRVTVGGFNGQVAVENTITVDSSGRVGIVGKDGVVINPFDPLADSLPQMTPAQVKEFNARGRFGRGDLFITPAAESNTVVAQPLARQ